MCLQNRRASAGVRRRYLGSNTFLNGGSGLLNRRTTVTRASATRSLLGGRAGARSGRTSGTRGSKTRVPLYAWDNPTMLLFYFQTLTIELGGGSLSGDFQR